MNKKVLSFGEILLRICPDAGGAWIRENQLPFYVGGAEANVATALALWGIPSAYCTALPDHLLSHQLIGYLKEKGVDTSRILFQGQRIGLYYLPKGKDLKNAGVIYDREHSSFWCLQPGTVDWDSVLHDVGWLHFSAISPALNARVARVCEELLEAAVERKITISVDLNYRSKLWQYGCAPTDIMPGLVRHCDMVMGNLWAAEKMLGIPVDAALTEGPKENYLEHARMSSERIMHAFPRVRWVAKTFRFDHGATGIRYYTTFYTGGKLYSSREYVSDTILDKVGSGDCFMAGLIYGLWKKLPVQDLLEFATAAAYQKLFIPSDATDQGAEDVAQFLMTYER
jgi:2-dehydro-3-deoxygluconokinase